MKTTQPATLRYQNRRGGFTVLELIVVMAIVVAMTGLAANVLKKTSSNYLGVSGEEISSLVDQVRSEAMVRNQPVQLRLVTKDTVDPQNAGRLYSVWAPQRDANGLIVCDGSGNPVFFQIFPWKQLKGGVSVIGQGAQWFNSSSVNQSGVNVFDESAVLPKNVLTGGMTYQGHTISQAMILEFKPDGSISTSSPGNDKYFYVLLAKCRGQAGEISARASEVTDKEVLNWRQIRLARMTGQVHMNAP